MQSISDPPIDEAKQVTYTTNRAPKDQSNATLKCAVILLLIGRCMVTPCIYICISFTYASTISHGKLSWLLL